MEKKSFLYYKTNSKVPKKVLFNISSFQYSKIKPTNIISYFGNISYEKGVDRILEVAKILKLKKNLLVKTLKKFKGLKYRQEIIFHSKKLTIINDSKATTLSSSVSMLKSITNVQWIVGGQAKKGDKLLLSKKDCKNIKAYIFGTNKKFFINKIKKIMKYESFLNLNNVVKKLSSEIKADKSTIHKIILFSPSAASFDSFKNFEKRGEYFNKLIKKYINA